MAWTPKEDEELECHEDTRKGVKDYDRHVVGLLKTPSRGENKTLVAYVPIEISSLIDYFLLADNQIAFQLKWLEKERSTWDW